jgi:hypothetical protein
MQNLNEYVFSDHYKERKQSRVENLEVVLSSDIYNSGENKDEIKEIIVEAIKRALKGRVMSFEMSNDVTAAKASVTIVAKIQLKRNGKIYSPVIKTTASGKTYEGNVFVGITKGNKIITILNIKEDDADRASLVKRSIENAKNETGEVISGQDIEIKENPRYVALLDVDFLINSKKSTDNAPAKIETPEDLPYKVKKDYVKSSAGRPNFLQHKEYGRGEVISSEKGMGGRWNNVSVKFPSGIKKFKTIYSIDYFPSVVKVERVVTESTLVRSLINEALERARKSKKC